MKVQTGVWTLRLQYDLVGSCVIAAIHVYFGGTEDAERSLAVASIRRWLGVMTMRCQASSLLGHLETLGCGGAAVRSKHQESRKRKWMRESGRERPGPTN